MLTNLEFKTKNENENKVKKLTWIVESSCEKEVDPGTTGMWAKCRWMQRVRKMLCKNEMVTAYDNCALLFLAVSYGSLSAQPRLASPYDVCVLKAIRLARLLARPNSK